MARRLGTRLVCDEDGQVLILFVIMTPVILLAAAVAIDYGLWLSERRGVARAADLSSLAAVQDLQQEVQNNITPASQSYTSEASCDAGLDSCRAAFDWAKRNNYEAGKGDVEVTVSYWCGNNLQTQPTNITVCVNENASTGGKTECSASLGKDHCDTIRVVVQKPAVRLFAGIFPAFSFDVGFSADASVNYRVKHLDAVMSIDASGSMIGDPITQARIGAENFTAVLFGDEPQNSNVQIGYTPFRAVHDNPPYDSNPPGSDGKVPWIGALTNGNCNPPPDESWAACLTKDDELLRAKYELTENSINLPGANAGGTNTCTGLQDAAEILLNSPTSVNNDPDLDRVIVILSDGDNNRDTNMDTCTLNEANNLRNNDDVAIYVIGLNVPGHTADPTAPDPNPNESPSTPGFCAQVGTDTGISESRRLLKCIASSAAGNDHYHETTDARELGNIFLSLAYEIAGTGLAGN
jgi:hypothetical protein